MADTVDDVVDYLGDHSGERTKFEGEIRIEGERRARARRVRRQRRAARPAPATTSTATRRRCSSAAAPPASWRCRRSPRSTAPATPAASSCRADVEAAVKFDEHGHISELALSGTFGGEANVGIEQFFGGTNADSKMPESFSLSAQRRGRGQVRRQARPAGPDRPAAGGRAAQQHGQRRRLAAAAAGPARRVRAAGAGRRHEHGERQVGHRHRLAGDLRDEHARTWSRGSSRPAATSRTCRRAS